MKRIIFIAPPAAGKGTQAKLLCEKYDLVHISAGDLLRKVSKNNAELKKKIDEGEFIDDSIIMNLMIDEINSIDSNGYVLDGFPRDMDQAVAFDKMITDAYSVIYINISKEEAQKRILGRLYCSNCGASYNEFVDDNKPEVQGVCDKCHSSLSRRGDDTVSTFENRFDTYVSCTEPLLEYYKNRQVLYTVDGTQDTMKVFSDIVQIYEGEI